MYVIILQWSVSTIFVISWCVCAPARAHMSDSTTIPWESVLFLINESKLQSN